MRMTVIDGLDVEAHFSAGIFGIADLIYKMTIDVEEEDRTLSIHPQRILGFQIHAPNTVIRAFFQSHQLIRRNFEHIPLFSCRRNGKSIVSVAQATEDQTIAKIAVQVCAAYM